MVAGQIRYAGHATEDRIGTIEVKQTFLTVLSWSIEDNFTDTRDNNDQALSQMALVTIPGVPADITLRWVTTTNRNSWGNGQLVAMRVA